MLCKVLKPDAGELPTPNAMLPGATFTLNIEFSQLWTPDFMTKIMGERAIMPRIWDTIEIQCRVVRVIEDLTWLVHTHEWYGDIDIVLYMRPVEGGIFDYAVGPYPPVLRCLT